MRDAPRNSLSVHHHHHHRPTDHPLLRKERCAGFSTAAVAWACAFGGPNDTRGNCVRAAAPCSGVLRWGQQTQGRLRLGWSKCDNPIRIDCCPPCPPVRRPWRVRVFLVCKPAWRRQSITADVLLRVCVTLHSCVRRSTFFGICAALVCRVAC